MMKPAKQSQSAKLTLLLVGWVFVVCLLQNSALFNVCSFKHSALDKGTAEAWVMSGESRQDLSEPCDLTEKLLASGQLSLDHIMVFSFLIVLAIVTWLIQTRPAFSAFTEPILPKSRVHLRICVFRE
ncbi:hypothetical protein [Vibrio sinaloensis]|uniref:hypothetical protein n=1 Tax=Photobacterium sp. (strain ATCC 43367) TaxID=379097 RepID=UPI0035E72E0F